MIPTLKDKRLESQRLGLPNFSGPLNEGPCPRFCKGSELGFRGWGLVFSKCKWHSLSPHVHSYLIDPLNTGVSRDPNIKVLKRREFVFLISGLH